MAGQVLTIGGAGLQVFNPAWNLVGVFSTPVPSVITWARAKRFDESATAKGLRRSGARTREQPNDSQATVGLPTSPAREDRTDEH